MKKNIESIINHEFLATNGLGGYAFGSLDGPNVRKYHSLYTISLSPPVQRVHMLTKMDAHVNLSDKRLGLSNEIEPGDLEVKTYCDQFVHKGTIFQSYSQGSITWRREMAFEYGSNAFAMVYEIDMPEDGALELTPWFNFRDHHETCSPDKENYHAAYEEETGIIRVTDGRHSLFMQLEGIYTPSNRFSQETQYPIESRRGYPDVEKHVILGSFKVPLIKGINRVEIKINVIPEFLSADKIFENRRLRYKELAEKSGFKHPQILKLVQAADDFVVQRQNTNKKTIVAGYPWFTDWGRDTMIALPGLTLVTGRYEEALEMLEGFLSKAYQGIIPNNFPDEGEAPMYNTSDGTLWLFNAIYAYYSHTKDVETIKRIFPDLITIIKHHMEGTINDIYMDSDGLLNTGNEETQLTWMDVKVDGWVVTPRHGKAVEINALWFNAIRVVLALSDLVGAQDQVMQLGLEALSVKVKESFNSLFWNASSNRLYDLIIDGVPLDIPRPNMIFSVSLSFPVLDESKWKSVVETVEKDFKVPFGLLTLRKDDPDFHAKYHGNLLSRDGAYHRGTAWGWLLGPFLEAHYKTFADRNRILAYLEEAFEHLDEGIHGSYSEIFEGAAPHAQRGCSAQAWSVAEILRIWWLIHNSK